VNPRYIAASGHHPALAAADNNRLIAQSRIVTFFDAGVKGVTIHMRYGKIMQFLMRKNAGGAALWAARTAFELG
jgi:hypothetical protein